MTKCWSHCGTPLPCRPASRQRSGLLPCSTLCRSLYNPAAPFVLFVPLALSADMLDDPDVPYSSY